MKIRWIVAIITLIIFIFAIPKLLVLALGIFLKKYAMVAGKVEFQDGYSSIVLRNVFDLPLDLTVTPKIFPRPNFSYTFSSLFGGAQGAIEYKHKVWNGSVELKARLFIPGKGFVKFVGNSFFKIAFIDKKFISYLSIVGVKINGLCEDGFSLNALECFYRRGNESEYISCKGDHLTGSVEVLNDSSLIGYVIVDNLCILHDFLGVHSGKFMIRGTLEDPKIMPVD